MKMFQIEKDFEYKGYRCIVLVNTVANRCGYVLINDGQPFYKHHFNEDELICHGGVTFCDYFEYVTNHEFRDIWAVGFDCGHSGDRFAVEDAIRYGTVDEKSEYVKDIRMINGIDGKELRSVVYCQQELRCMVDQLEEMYNADCKEV